MQKLKKAMNESNERKLRLYNKEHKINNNITNNTKNANIKTISRNNTGNNISKCEQTPSQLKTLSRINSSIRKVNSNINIDTNSLPIVTIQKPRIISGKVEIVEDYDLEEVNFYKSSINKYEKYEYDDKLKTIKTNNYITPYRINQNMNQNANQNFETHKSSIIDKSNLSSKFNSKAFITPNKSQQVINIYNTNNSNCDRRLPSSKLRTHFITPLKKVNKAVLPYNKIDIPLLVNKEKRYIILKEDTKASMQRYSNHNGNDY